MPFVPSTVLAKDLVGEALELANAQDVRTQLRANQTAYYNDALLEIWTILGYVDSEIYTFKRNRSFTDGDFVRHKIISFSDNTIEMDKIVAVELSPSGDTFDKIYDTHELSIKEFLNHKRNFGAMHPYDESVVYITMQNSMEFIFGETISEASIASLTPKLYARELPELLTEDNRENLYVGLPTKYVPLLKQRILSYAEVSKGITDKALVMIKNSYEQLLATVEPTVRGKIMAGVM